MIKFNKETLRDKIYACWLGKNIGGTMGMPYEGKREMQDIKGFATAPGVPVPNDDLDLQLIWLRALDEQGPEHINSKVLGEYWTDYVAVHWNEYGVCKANMRRGILPPLSGNMNNEQWMHSNGAWIRTEIWACTNPGLVERAIRLAFEDAAVDHGFGEGTYGAIFVAALESAAFVFSDMRTLIKIGLSKIPADCRVARSIGIVLDCYDNGIDWKEARQRVVKDSEDLGWFQAPANIAFAILGLVYGEGDFKKSMILAINCGDDTDCTGATVGSILGIINGTAGIPEDWRAHIGDAIVSVATVGGVGYLPETCTQLTDCVMKMLPLTTRTYLQQAHLTGEECVIYDGEDDFGSVTVESLSGDTFVKLNFDCSPYSFSVDNTFTDVYVEFDREPVIEALGELNCKVTAQVKNYFGKANHYELKWHLPDGWSVDGPRHVFSNEWLSPFKKRSHAQLVIKAPEKIEAVNSLILEVRCPEHAMPILVPVTILG